MERLPPPAILEQLNSEIEKHIEEGTSTFPVEEQFRISWDGIACWPYLSHNLRTLKKYGINMVASSYGKAWAIEYEDLRRHGTGLLFRFHERRQCQHHD